MPVLYWFNVAALQPLLVWVILIWTTSPTDLTVSAGWRRIAYLRMSGFGPLNQYGCYDSVLTTQNPTDVAWSSSARAELPPWLLQAGPLDAEELGASLSPKGVYFYLTTAFAGHITATLPVFFLNQRNSERNPFSNKTFSQVLPQRWFVVVRLGGGKGPCKMASSTSLRNAIWVLKISFTAWCINARHEKPVCYIGTISCRQAEERERQGTRQLERVGGVIIFRTHTFSNFFCLSDGLGLFLL